MEEGSDEKCHRATLGHRVADEAAPEGEDHRAADRSGRYEAEPSGQVGPGPGLQPTHECLLGDHGHTDTDECDGKGDPHETRRPAAVVSSRTRCPRSAFKPPEANPGP